MPDGGVNVRCYGVKRLTRYRCPADKFGAGAIDVPRGADELVLQKSAQDRVTTEPATSDRLVISPTVSVRSGFRSITIRTGGH